MKQHRGGREYFVETNCVLNKTEMYYHGCQQHQQSTSEGCPHTSRNCHEEPTGGCRMRRTSPGPRFMRGFRGHSHHHHRHHPKRLNRYCHHDSPRSHSHGGHDHGRGYGHGHGHHGHKHHGQGHHMQHHHASPGHCIYQKKPISNCEKHSEHQNSCSFGKKHQGEHKCHRAEKSVQCEHDQSEHSSGEETEQQPEQQNIVV